MNVWLIVSLVFATAVAIYVIYNIVYTKRHGIKADAVVSRIEERLTGDSDGSTVDYDIYVEYRDADGNAQEAKISNQGFKSFEVGDKLLIKYLPNKPHVAVWVKE